MNPTLKPLKRFGQNFLVDKNIIRKIVSAVDPSSREAILEIGPGDGALTFLLAQKAKHVVAVEIDRGRCRQLQEKAKALKNIDVICRDILKFKINKNFKVVGNLPYYLTTPIIEHLFAHLKYISDIFIMTQKEVAQRLVALPGTGSYGSLTCFVNYYSIPKVLFPIKSGSFWPRPKVESSFVHLRPRQGQKKFFGVRSEQLLFKVIRRSFGQRRKQLCGSLAGVWDREKIVRLPSADLLKKRPEELGLADFARIANDIFDNCDQR